jgi:hypothetical protein
VWRHIGKGSLAVDGRCDRRTWLVAGHVPEVEKGMTLLACLASILGGRHRHGSSLGELFVQWMKTADGCSVRAG